MTYIHDWVATRAAFEKADALLLDFDGPICSVFSGLPADKVANRLRNHLHRDCDKPLPGLPETGPDPFGVMAFVSAHVPESVEAIEAELTRQECEAIQMATPTEGAHTIIRQWGCQNRPLAIVSNNSIAAIQMYLTLHGLVESVSVISARTPRTVDKLKPSPHLLRIALSVMGVSPSNTVFVGDSNSDMKAGIDAGVVRVAFANKPWKIQSLGPLSNLLIERFGP